MVIFHSYVTVYQRVCPGSFYEDMNVIGPISGLVQCVQVCHDLPKKKMFCVQHGKIEVFDQDTLW